jgi:hypothetical protein
MSGADHVSHTAGARFWLGPFGPVYESDPNCV